MPRLTLQQKKARNGWLYITPWLIGMLVFFIPAMLTTVIYCFSNVDITSRSVTYVGLDNFHYVLREDAQFPILLGTILLTNLKNIPLVLIFSYLVALLLKKPFKGSRLVKGIFFITVILSSDVFLTMTSELSYLQTAQTSNTLENTSTLFASLNGDTFASYLTQFGISSDWVGYITDAVDSVSDIFNRSGVQIFIFLSALGSVPDSMYEAAYIEGATSWEAFWKITFPMTSSFIVVNFVYTVVDSFNSMLSPALQYIDKMGFRGDSYGYGSAMSIVYFVIIGIIMAAVLLASRKKLFYYV